jgi:hypothetical protein
MLINIDIRKNRKLIHHYSSVASANNTQLFGITVLGIGKSKDILNIIKQNAYFQFKNKLE